MERIKKLQKLLKEWKVEGCLIENRIDLFYLTGFDLSAGTLLVLRRSCRLFIDGRYLESVRREKKIPFAKLETLDTHLKGELAFDSCTTSFARYQQLKKQKCTLKPIPRLLKQLRGKKDPEEIELLKKSGTLNLQGIEYIQKLLKEGITEKELASAFEIFCLKKGAEKLSFEPIIAFGANTALPHHRAGSTVLKKGDLVLMDVGVVVGRYCSDLTRIFFFGKKDLELKKIETAVKEAHAAALALCRSGVKVSALEDAAHAVIKKAGLEKLLAHGLGHGVGLEVHEYPRINKKSEDKDLLLESGMVITIEPGLYLPGKGGIRYEDTVIIKENGYEFAL